MQRLAFALALVLGSAASLAAQAKSGDRPVTTKVTLDKTVWPDEGPRKWAPRKTESAITANDLRTRLYQFADDSMAGRRIGELGNWKGTEYIASEFKRLGLKPAGDNGTWFQELPFGPTGFDAAVSRLTTGTATIAPTADWIPLTPAANNGLGSRMSTTNAPVVYAGRWADNTPLDPALYRGKIVVFSGAPGAGGGGGGRGTVNLQSCDALPDRFGARMAAYSDSVTAAGRGSAAGGAGGAGGVGAGADTILGPDGPLGTSAQFNVGADGSDGLDESSHVKVFSFPGLEILFQFYNDGNPRNLQELNILREAGLPPPGNSFTPADSGNPNITKTN